MSAAAALQYLCVIPLTMLAEKVPHSHIMNKPKLLAYAVMYARESESINTMLQQCGDICTEIICLISLAHLRNNLHHS